MEIVKNKMMRALEYIKTFFKWVLFATVVGALGGVVGSLFHICIDFVTELRGEKEWLIFLLPLGGAVIAILYGFAKKRIDTNRVIESVRTEKEIPWYMAPLIFISTIITHLFGGSAGREGAALQLGGSLGYTVGKLFKLNRGDMHIIVMAGMSAVFTALFGTPLTAIFFALEVTSVGVMYYAGLLPCMISSLLAYSIAGGFGISPVSFELSAIPETGLLNISRVVILAALCALVCILFCMSMEKCEQGMERFIKNKILRAVIGGAVVLALTLLLGTYDYNGAGMNVIERALSGDARPEAFLLKIIFTAITISAGFKGGEIVPAFFVGATFGCVAGPLLGLDAGFAAAVGFVALFCGLVNCPVASVFLALEIFGAESLVPMALVCGVSYMMSGYCGLYKSQKIVYSKLEAKFIDVSAK